jgi:kumamolisin
MFRNYCKLHNDKPGNAKSGNTKPGNVKSGNTKSATQIIDGAYFPTELASLYNFPSGDGTGQKIGIIELGGGYDILDIVTYFQHLGINNSPHITNISIMGAVNDPSDTSGANYEVVLDIQVIAAIVPNAYIYVYFAPNSDAGFLSAIQTAINQGCKVISISWGAPEDNWDPATMNAFNNLFKQASEQGITICVATGDNGSSDGESGTHVDFPASSPYVLAVGGTTLTSVNNAISSETVWNNNPTTSGCTSDWITSATGGGTSAIFNTPDYQILIATGGKRGVPDVSGNANPKTGYKIYIAGNFYVIGGTSAVAPLWAALAALVSQHIGHSVGFLNPLIYAAGLNNNNVCRDISRGNNGSFTAVLGWDRCTGWGSPNGALLLAFLQTPTPFIKSVFSMQIIHSKIPLKIRCVNQSVGNPISYEWDFGDKTPHSHEQNPTHTYTRVGGYVVQLTVVDASGNTNSSSKFIAATR